MTLYVAIIALLNLIFGYALAVFLHKERHPLALSSGDVLDIEEVEAFDDETDDWGS